MASPPLGFLESVRFSWLVNVLLDHWVACMLVMIATCLTRSVYKRFGIQHKENEAESKTPSSQPTPLFGLSSQFWYRLKKPSEAIAIAPIGSRPSDLKTPMRYQRTPRRVKAKKKLIPTADPPRIPGIVQPFEAFLVLDVEGTCNQGTDFNYPNEIIELPVFLLQWKDRTADGVAGTLEVVDEFRTFVKPTWRPVLSEFCMELTGITQEQVDSAPQFSEALVSLEAFLVKHGLIEMGTGKRQKRFCWCSDGPWDIRDFFVKQCFISQVEMPEWIRGDVLDVRFAVLQWKNTQATSNTQAPVPHMASGAIRPSFNIPAQLKALGLPAFEGRQHSGIDVSGELWASPSYTIVEIELTRLLGEHRIPGIYQRLLSNSGDGACYSCRIPRYTLAEGGDGWENMVRFWRTVYLERIRPICAIISKALWLKYDSIQQINTPQP